MIEIASKECPGTMHANLLNTLIVFRLSKMFEEGRLDDLAGRYLLPSSAT